MFLLSFVCIVFSSGCIVCSFLLCLFSFGCILPRKHVDIKGVEEASKQGSWIKEYPIRMTSVLGKLFSFYPNFVLQLHLFGAATICEISCAWLESEVKATHQSQWFKRTTFENNNIESRDSQKIATTQNHSKTLNK